MDLFTKRCGCGRILKQRESCSTCADRKRAEMHARGVANDERVEGAQLWNISNSTYYLWKPKALPAIGTPRPKAPDAPHWTDCYKNPPPPTDAGRAFIEATKAAMKRMMAETARSDSKLWDDYETHERAHEELCQASSVLRGKPPKPTNCHDEGRWHVWGGEKCQYCDQPSPYRCALKFSWREP